MSDTQDAATVLDELRGQLQVAEGATVEDIMAAVEARAKKAAGPDDPAAQEQIERMIADQLDKQVQGRKFQPAVVADAGDVDTKALPQQARFRSFIERPAPASEAHRKAVQVLNDEVLILDALLRGSMGNAYGGMRTLQRFSKLQAELRAMDTSETGGGTEYVPTGFSSDFWENADARAVVAPMFGIIEIPRGVGSLDLPGLTGHSTVYLWGESTADEAAKITASQPTTAKRTLTPVGLKARTLVSTELDEDSAVAILPLIRNDLIGELAKARDDAIINGDTAATHQDSDVTASTDHRKAWVGLRKSALAAAKKDLATYTADNIIALRIAMDYYAENPSDNVWIGGISSATKLILLRDAQNNLINANQVASGQPMLRGQVTTMFGSPVLASGYIRGTLNASGVYDGATMTKTLLLNAYRPAWVLGAKRDVTLKTDEDISTDQMILVLTYRADFKSRQPTTTEKVVGVGYNITTA